MNPFTAYRLHITPLSPVHIGTGESYELTNYVIEDGALHEFDTGAAMAALLEKDREELLRIASGKPDIRMVLAMQKFFFDRRKYLTWGDNCCPVAHGVSKRYSDRIGKAAQIEQGGRIIVNELSIDRTAYNQITRQPVLLGSSLKGSIRTALLDKINQGQLLRSVENRATGRIGKENNQQLQQRLFQYAAGKFELDPLRRVQLADAPRLIESGLPATQVRFAVSRYKRNARDKNGNPLNTKADKGPEQLLECVAGLSYRAFTGQINLQSLNGVDQKSQNKLPAENLCFNIEEIAYACHNFYKDRLSEENDKLRELGLLDSSWNEIVCTILENGKSKFDTGQAFLLRVGRHSGAESVTLNGVRNIKIMQADGKPATYEKETKTLWLAAEDKDQRQNLLPFGWLLVEVEPLDKPAQDWPQLRELCEPHLKTARAFAQERENQREALEKARLEAEARRREEEALARQKAEAEEAARRAEAERQAKLAAMSEQARQIQAFRQRMEAEGKSWANQGNGANWLRDLRELVNQAKGWEAADQAALLDLVKEISQLDPRLAPKKNDKIKELVRSLSA